MTTTNIPCQVHLIERNSTIRSSSHIQKTHTTTHSHTDHPYDPQRTQQPLTHSHHHHPKHTSTTAIDQKKQSKRKPNLKFRKTIPEDANSKIAKSTRRIPLPRNSQRTSQQQQQQHKYHYPHSPDPIDRFILSLLTTHRPPNDDNRSPEKSRPELAAGHVS